MKKIWIILISVVAAATTGLSQYKDGSESLIIGVSNSLFKAADYNLNMTGYGFGGNYESNFPSSNWAIGFSFGWIRSSEDIDTATVSFATLPVNIYGKYFIGNPALRAYLSLGIGIHTSTAIYSGPVLYKETYDNGFALNAGVGLNTYLSEKVFFTFGYNLGYWHNSYLENSIGHNFILALGFQI